MKINKRRGREGGWGRYPAPGPCVGSCQPGNVTGRDSCQETASLTQPQLPGIQGIRSQLPRLGRRVEVVVRELEVTGLHGKDLLQCPYAVKAKRNARNSPRRGQFLTKPPTRNALSWVFMVK